MARPKGNPTELIKRLQAALGVAKPRDVVLAQVMAEIAGMTWRNLLITHIEPDPKFPIEHRGSEGDPYRFRVVKVLKHMIMRAKERQAENNTRAKRIMELTGFNVPEDSTEAMSVADVNRLIEANMRAQKAKVEQGRYVPADQVRLFLIGYNAQVRNAILGEPQKLDPVGALPIEIRQTIDDDMRNLAVALQERVEGFLEDFSAASGPGGTA